MTKMAFVERSEEQIAKQWLAENNMAAVDWVTLSRLAEDPSILEQKILVFDAKNCTYRLKV